VLVVSPEKHGRTLNQFEIDEHSASQSRARRGIKLPLHDAMSARQYEVTPSAVEHTSFAHHASSLVPLQAIRGLFVYDGPTVAPTDIGPVRAGSNVLRKRLNTFG
jgi:hypothetical protein